MSDTTPEVPRVVIIGGGFAGLNTAKSLNRSPVRVTLLDRQNYHLFQPLLYQVATAALNPSDIAYPLRSALSRQKNTSVLLAEARDIDRMRRRVLLDNGFLDYDYLVVATGATHSHFGHPDWERTAPGLKSVADALEIRRRIFVAYEAAERESDPIKKQAWLTFVVVGGGPTGVELAGALAEIGRQSMGDDFRTIDPRQVRVILAEGANRILAAYPDSLASKAVRQLNRLGVEVRLSSPASNLGNEGVTIGEEHVRARTILWAAGVRASSLAESLNTPLDKAGRVHVEGDLSIKDDPNVFVIGDLAHITTTNGLVPGVCPAAIQQGKYVAETILRRISQRSTTPFRYIDKGSLATIGRGKAIAHFGRIRISGFLAWMAWLSIHIFFLIGFRNRLWVLSGWAWSYLTYQRGARLITGRTELSELPEISNGHRQSRPFDRLRLPTTENAISKD